MRDLTESIENVHGDSAVRILSISELAAMDQHFRYEQIEYTPEELAEMERLFSQPLKADATGAQRAIEAVLSIL